MQYDGSRYYDPALGSYLQPHSFISPGLPQSLNRHGATSSGLVARCLANMACGLVTNKLLGLAADGTEDRDGLTAKGLKALGLSQVGMPYYVDMPVYRLSGIRIAKNSLEVTHEVLGEFAAVGKRHPQTRLYLGTMIYKHLDKDEFVTESNFLSKGYLVKDEPTGQQVKVKFAPGSGPKFFRSLLNKALPAAIDAGFQIHQDAQNPALSNGIKTGRVIVAVSVGAFGGYVANIITKAVFGATPSGWAILGVSLAVGLVENDVAGGINDLFLSGPKKEFVPLE